MENYIEYIILLLESPCLLVRSYVRDKILAIVVWCVRRGLSAQRARRTKSSWSDGPPTRGWGPEGPLTSS